MESQSPKPVSVNIGKRLKELRQERGKSMRALAYQSRLSPNALSMIERGHSSPSVSTLYKLSEALEVPITSFFRTVPPREFIVFRKANQRTQVPFHRGIWEGLGGESFIGRVEPFMLTLESGASSGPFGMLHTGHEFVLCIQGQLEYQVDEHRFEMEAGDCLLFAARLRHRWRNPGKRTTQVAIVLVGFEEDEHPSEFHLAAGQSGSTFTQAD